MISKGERWNKKIFLLLIKILRMGIKYFKFGEIYIREDDENIYLF